MIIHTHEQGSPGWYNSRSGCITASMFSSARYKTKKGEWSAEARNYAFSLALERLGGMPLDQGYETWAMKRGKELEPAAREKLAKTLGVEIGVPGFITDDYGCFGASADGLIGDDGGCEIKCLVSAERISRVLVDGDLSEYMDQIQGGMWITGRSWWEYALYLPQLESVGRSLFHKRVFRDDAYITSMEKDLKEFDALVCQTVDALKNQLPETHEGRDPY